MKRVLVAAGLVLAACLMPASANAAADAPGLRPANPGPPGTASAGYFDYHAAPGDQFSDEVEVINSGSTAADYLLYPVDALTSKLSGISFPDRGSPLADVGRWVRLSGASLHLAAGSRATVGFVVTVPRGLGPGDYVAGIAGENSQPTPGGGSGQVNIRTVQRAILAVVVHLPGPAAPGFSLGEAALTVENSRRQVIEQPMSSTGNLIAKPRVEGTLRTCDGRNLLDLSRQLDSFIPHSEIRYPFYLDSVVLEAGCYQVQVVLSVNGQKLAEHTSQIQVTVAQQQLPARVTPTPSGPPHQVPGEDPGRRTVLIAGAIAVPLLVLNGVLLFLVLRHRRR